LAQSVHTYKSMTRSIDNRYVWYTKTSKEQGVHKWNTGVIKLNKQGGFDYE